MIGEEQSGWFIVWRDEEERYGIPEGTLTQWLDLKRSVAWQRTIRPGPQGQDVTLEAGQMVFQLRDAAKKWGWSVNRVRRWISKLKARSVVNTVTTNAFTLLSIACIDDIRDPNTVANTDADTDANTDADTVLHYREPYNHLTIGDGLFPSLDLESSSAADSDSPIFAKNRRDSKLTQAKTKVRFNTPEMKRVGRIWRRRESTLWTVAEYLALEELGDLAEEDIAAKEAYYLTGAVSDGKRDFRSPRSDLITGLNHWHQDLDRERNWCREHPAAYREHAPKRSNVVPMALTEDMCECC